jgi:hypothetical protein
MSKTETIRVVTTGEIAREVKADRNQIRYILERDGIAPLGVVGRARVYDPSAVDYVRGVLRRRGVNAG